MRCKNCGWENASGNARCEKCNAPLMGSMIEGNDYRAGHSGSAGGGEVNLHATVSEAQFFGSSPVEPSHAESGARPSSQSSQVGKSSGSSLVSCPQCGYMLAPQSKHCPNCGAEMQSSSGNKSAFRFDSRADLVPSSPSPHAAEGEKCRQCGQPIPKGARFCPVCGTPKRMGTVNPWATPQGENKFCTLRPIAWEKEDIQFNPLSYSGNNIILNRANTDPNNQTITSQQQAELICENGEWYIIDKSAQQTTYVHAKNKIKLQSGDTIILGNRRFEFNA